MTWFQFCLFQLRIEICLCLLHSHPNRRFWKHALLRELTSDCFWSGALLLSVNCLHQEFCLLWIKDDSSANWGLLFCLFLLLPYSKSSSDVTIAILSCLCSKIYFIWCIPTSNSRNLLSMVNWSLNVSMRPSL